MNALLRFWSANGEELATLIGEHIFLVAVSTTVGVAVGVPVGIFAARRARLAAPLVGFVNIGHFSNAFKDFYGVPPSQYMENHLQADKGKKLNERKRSK